MEKPKLYELISHYGINTQAYSQKGRMAIFYSFGD